MRHFSKHIADGLQSSVFVSETQCVSLWGDVHACAGWKRYMYSWQCERGTRQEFDGSDLCRGIGSVQHSLRTRRCYGMYPKALIRLLSSYEGELLQIAERVSSHGIPQGSSLLFLCIVNTTELFVIVAFSLHVNFV